MLVGLLHFCETRRISRPARSPSINARRRARRRPTACRMRPRTAARRRDQFIRDLFHRDAVLFQRRDRLAGAVYVLLYCIRLTGHDRGTHPSSPEEWCSRCRGRSALPHTSCPVGRILGAGRSPEQTLRLRAPAAAKRPQRGPENSVLYRCRPASHWRSPPCLAIGPRACLSTELVQSLVDRGVDAADEEARDARDRGNVAARLLKSSSPEI